jgi:hypothetical protein
MLESLISSKTRIKILLKFFLNKNLNAHLRSLENEFGESSNAIRIELNRLEESGMLSSYAEGNKKKFCANQQHPLFNDIHGILLKYVGLDKVIEQVTEKLGNPEKVFLTGAFAKGLDNHIIDLIFVGEIDKLYLSQIIEKSEDLIHRKIRYTILNREDFSTNFQEKDAKEMLLLWSNEN